MQHPAALLCYRQLSFVARRLHHCAILLSSSAGQRESLAFGKVFILGHTLLTKKNSRREFDHFGRSDDEREVARAGGRARGYEKIWFRVYCQGRKKVRSTLCTLVFTVRAYACKMSSCLRIPRRSEKRQDYNLPRLFENLPRLYENLNKSGPISYR